MIRTLALIILTVSSQLCLGQKKLRQGQVIPFSRVEVFDKDNRQTQIDLPNGKNTTDRFVLVLFFTSEQPLKKIVEINQKIEQILNRFQNNACKGASEIEFVTICAEKDVAVWQNYLTQGNLINSKFSGKKTNYLTKGGLNDKAIKVFAVDKFPSFFVVNPKGRLWLETDSASSLERAFQSICRTNASYSTADIAGKILTGEKNKMPLADHKVFLVNHKQDTLKSTKTDNYGDFLFTKVDTTAQSLSIRLENNEKTNNGQKIYLARQNGDVVREFSKNAKGVFEYRLLKAEVIELSPVEDEDDITLKYKKFDISGLKNLSVTENIYYESGKYNVTYEGELVLDKVLTILNANPAVKLEVISHTDSQGDDASNMTLSEKRSDAVVEYLASKGVDKGRLKAVGKGETMIRNRFLNGVACSNKENEYNRRTEFYFIKN
ncbi:MAG: OmpA family protein [Bacteroidia bacterium]